MGIHHLIMNKIMMEYWFESGYREFEFFDELQGCVVGER